MSHQRFKQALVLLGLAMLVAIGSIFSSVGQPRMAQSEIDRLAEQLKVRVTSRTGKAITACYSFDSAAKCDGIRKEANRVVAEIDTAKRDNPNSLRGWSQLLDKWETETTPMLQTMESSAAVVRNFQNLSGR